MHNKAQIWPSEANLLLQILLRITYLDGELFMKNLIIKTTPLLFIEPLNMICMKNAFRFILIYLHTYSCIVNNACAHCRHA